MYVVDKTGQPFFVEMQVIWSEEFEYRVSFAASEAYVQQMKLGEEYELPRPVYSLHLSDVIYEPEWDGYYHHYDKVYVKQSGEMVNGLHLVLVELPKFMASSCVEEKMKTLWLRYLTEIKEKTREVPPDLLTTPEVNKAIMTLEESTFTEAQLWGHEKFWDIISVEKTLMSSSRREGLEEGEKIGIEKGEKIGIEKGIKVGREEGILLVASKAKKQGLSYEMISGLTGLSIAEIEKL